MDAWALAFGWDAGSSASGQPGGSVFSNQPRGRRNSEETKVETTSPALGEARSKTRKELITQRNAERNKRRVSNQR